jgi:hypothetical protein
LLVLLLVLPLLLLLLLLMLMLLLMLILMLMLSGGRASCRQSRWSSRRRHGYDISTTHDQATSKA